MSTTKQITLTVLFILLSACGDKSIEGTCSDSPLLGTWDNALTGDVIRLSGSCTGTSSTCQSKFSWAIREEEDPDLVLLEVSETNGAEGCLPVGDNFCDFAHDGDEFSIQCEDQPILTYLRRE